MFKNLPPVEPKSPHAWTFNFSPSSTITPSKRKPIKSFFGAAAPVPIRMSTSLNDTTTVNAHFNLLGGAVKKDSDHETKTAPLFTYPVQQHALEEEKKGQGESFTQYGLLAGAVKHDGESEGFDTEDFGSESDPRIFQNVTAPSSTFICGSQGSGKSHTLSCMLENCLVSSAASILPRPLTGLVFHYDSFISDTGGSPCEAAYLSSNPGVKVRVLCPPTNVAQIRRIYKSLHNVTVEELRISQTDLDTKRMMDLMAVSSIAGGMPLYLHVILRILRELRMTQQENNSTFDYTGFKRAVEQETMTEGQLAPLKQRLETLESFMVDSQTQAYDMFAKTLGKKSVGSKKTVRSYSGNDWTPKPGQLTIVDLSCPCVTAETACALFNICLSLFLERSSDIARVVALDEAHKYMTGGDGAECQTLTDALIATIRLQRHNATRIIVSTQEPTISPKLLDLCSTTIVHRFTSPDWLSSLSKHLAGASGKGVVAPARNLGVSDLLSDEEEQKRGVQPLFLEGVDAAAELFPRILALHTGEALIFSPAAIVGTQPVAANKTSAHSSSGKTSEAGSSASLISATGNDDGNSSSSAVSPSADSATSGIFVKRMEKQESLITFSSSPDAVTDRQGEKLARVMGNLDLEAKGCGSGRKEIVRLGMGVLKVKIRARITADGGQSVLAN